MSGWDLRIEDVRYAYAEVEALRGVSLAIRSGESVALVGKNGAGKTTLTRLLVALIRPAAGHVAVGDWDVALRRPDEMARRIGYVFQHADQQLFARSVREDVAFGTRRLGRHGPVDAVLEELSLASYADVHPYDVPAPLRKLVALAGVLAMEPGVFVLDEPTAGLDRSQRELVVAALRRRSALGVTVLAVSHDLGFVAETAERVLVMESGRLAADRPAREFLYDAGALAALSLRPPATAEIGRVLKLPDAPIRSEEVAAAMRGVRWKQNPE
ncbi:MAG TPA: ABC transporter ATP-binding protein [Gemmatimonadales bacterium]|nr:ABC transporter ATP-binding protein [Gemmatimonadales bacterium]